MILSFDITSNSALHTNDNDYLFLNLSLVRDQLTVAQADVFWNEISADGGNIRVYHGENQVARQVMGVDVQEEQGFVYLDGSAATPNQANTWTLVLEEGATEPAPDSTFGSEAVWDAYGAVWLMDNDGTQFFDSSGNGNHATIEGNPEFGIGELGHFANFRDNQEDDAVITGSETEESLEVGTGSATYGGWVSMRNGGGYILANSTAFDNMAYEYILNPESENGRIRPRWDGAPGEDAYNVDGLDDGQYNHLTTVFNRSTNRVEFYADSVLISDSETPPTDIQNVTDTRFASRNGSSFAQYESSFLFFRKGEISAEFVETEYNNSVDNDAFWTLENWEVEVLQGTGEISGGGNLVGVGNSKLYHLQISEDSNFSFLEYDSNTITGEGRELTLSEGVQYWWRVRQWMGDEWSDWSAVWSFSTEEVVEGESAEIESLTVTSPSDMEGQSDFQLGEGGVESADIEASVLTEGGASDNVSWESSDEAIATVTSTGNRTARVDFVADGVANITASTIDDQRSMTVTCVGHEILTDHQPQPNEFEV